MVKEALPHKEAGIFKKILKCYEQKQYKQGLKLCSQILGKDKLSEHGETLAMKGLILSNQGKKTEGHDLVKKGLRNDLTSPVCWHVFGLLQRAEHKYEEACKAYQNALKWDKDNMSILRDLSLLQVQMRDLVGYKITRYRLLELRPSQKISWVGYAIANHLVGDLDVAITILEKYLETETIDDQEKNFGRDVAKSELLLYMFMIKKEMGPSQAAYDFLKSNKAEICDPLAYNTCTVEMLVQLNRNDEAETLLRKLIAQNPENRNFIQSLLQVCSQKSTKHEQVLGELHILYPRSNVIICEMLKVLPEGEQFDIVLGKFIKMGLQKGVTPLFLMLKSTIYSDKSKRLAVERIATTFKTNLETSSCFPDATPDELKESPSTLIWIYYFLSQHYAAVQNFSEALGFIDKALDIAPTLVELHLQKGAVFKYAGNLPRAAECVDEAQSLDTADRYINCKAVKYLLRTDMVDSAEQLAGKFTRPDGTSVLDSLNENQCLWYLHEAAQAHLRLHALGRCLEKCHQVEKHFVDITEDQFDYHMYCIRRCTLTAYVRTLRLEDNLRDHKFYSRTAKLACSVYFALHDNPALREMSDPDSDPSTNGSSGDKVDEANLSPAEKAELRKKRAKERKAAAKKAAAENITKDQNANSSPASNDAKPDSLSAEFRKTSVPLEEASKFVQPLINLCDKDISSWHIAFELYDRMDKPLRMLQCVSRMSTLEEGDAPSPTTHLCFVRLIHRLATFQSRPEAQNAAMCQLKTLLSKWSPSHKDAQDVNANFLKAHSSSFPHTIACARAYAHIEMFGQAIDVLKACPSTSFEWIGGAPHPSDRDLLTAVIDDLSGTSLNPGPLTVGNAERPIVKELEIWGKSLFPMATRFGASPFEAKALTNGSLDKKMAGMQLDDDDDQQHT